MREKTEYSAVKLNVNLKSRAEDIKDVASYFNELSDKDKAWMNKFMEEYNNASFKKNNEQNLMKTDQEKRDSYNRNNARNRDIYNRLKMNNDLVYIEDLNNQEKRIKQQKEQEFDNNDESLIDSEFITNDEE